MSDGSAPPPGPAPRSGWPTLALAALVAVAVLVGVLALAQMNKDYEVALDRDGRMTIKVASGANLRDILVSALESDRASVEEALAARGYHHFADPRLVARLEELRPDEPAHAAAIAAHRRLLADQRGPFVMPDALLGFDARLIDALGSLEAKLEESRQTSALLIELWRQSLEYQGIFRPRMFEARVIRYPASGVGPGAVSGSGSAAGGGFAMVLGCPGSDFTGKEVMLTPAAGGGSVSGFIVTSDRHRCAEQDQKLADLFSREEAVFGLDALAYQRLFSPEAPEAHLPDELPARFQFLPTGTATLALLQAKLGELP